MHDVNNWNTQAAWRTPATLNQKPKPSTDKPTCFSSGGSALNDWGHATAWYSKLQSSSRNCLTTRPLWKCQRDCQLATSSGSLQNFVDCSSCYPSFLLSFIFYPLMCRTSPLIEHQTIFDDPISSIIWFLIPYTFLSQSQAGLRMSPFCSCSFFCPFDSSWSLLIYCQSSHQASWSYLTSERGVELFCLTFQLQPTQAFILSSDRTRSHFTPAGYGQWLIVNAAFQRQDQAWFLPPTLRYDQDPFRSPLVLSFTHILVHYFVCLYQMKWGLCGASLKNQLKGTFTWQ